MPSNARPSVARRSTAEATPASDPIPSTQLTCRRQTARQATSAVAHVAPVPPADDPLLGFVPYAHKQPRRNSITPDKQRKFIATLAATGIVTQAARSIGKSMEALYKLRALPGAEGFAAAWDAAVDRGVQRLEDTALARAIEGTPIWKHTPDGGLITYGMKHNEALVMFFLKNRRPERYSEHIRPGHPVYERIRRELEAERMAGGADKGACDGQAALDAIADVFARIEAARTADGRDDGVQGSGADAPCAPDPQLPPPGPQD